MLVLYPLLIALFALVLYIYTCITKYYDYWKKRNVPHLKPLFLFGNYKDYILLKKSSQIVAQEICKAFPGEPYVGVYYGTVPALIIKDPDLIKLVMSKDFYYFNNREISEHTHKEVITQNMFFNGGDTWKVLRQNLTSLFSSAKIKNMFYLIEICAQNLESELKRVISNKDEIEVKTLLAKYTMDCIGSCAFGINTNTLKENSAKNPFTIMGQKLFDLSNYGGYRIIGRAMWPNLFYKLKQKLFDKQVEVFFKQLITEVFKSRQYKESNKNDFVDLILGWKKKTYLIGDKVSNMITEDKATTSLEVTDDLLIAQCILFFAAGFETTSTVTSFMLYELAKNKNAQNRVIDEIDDYFRRHEGKIEYECINEMPFLQACLEETLRLYPVLGVLTREVTEDYTLPTGLLLEKGCRIHIPVHYMHHNPEYYPEPEEFRPERFWGEEKKNIKQFTYMPFGEGPRICIGLRFAKMPIVAGLLSIFKNYKVELAAGMPKKVEFEPRLMVTQAISGLHLKFIPRKV